MKLQAKKQFLFGKEVLSHGVKFETNDAHGKELIARGLAQEVKAQAASEKQEESKRRGK